MAKEKIKSNDVLEKNEEQIKKKKKEFGLIAEEIEEIEDKKNNEDFDSFDEEEYEEEIEDFVPQLTPIKLESKIETMFPKKQEEEESEEDSEKEQPKSQEQEKGHENPMDEMIKKFAGKKIKSPDIVKGGSAESLDIRFIKGEFAKIAQDIEESNEIKYSSKKITGKKEKDVEGLRKGKKEDVEYSSDELKDYESKGIESELQSEGEASGSEK